MWPQRKCEACGLILPSRVGEHVCGMECRAEECTRERNFRKRSKGRYCKKHERQLYRNRKKGIDHPYTQREAANLGLKSYYDSLK